MSDYPQTVCGCEYDGINEDGCIEWRTAACETHRPRPTVLVTSEALMFAEQSIPWPDERPYEKTLGDDGGGLG